MKNFMYTIKDQIGIHARPAGILVNEAKKYKSKITIRVNGKESDATKLLGLMTLGVKNGEEISVTIDGEDEEQALEGFKGILEANL